MALDIDVLIHFADKDNDTAKQADTGWVSQFRKFLELMLYQVLGTKPNIVLKSEFDSATASTMDNAAVLVAILSKDFVKSGRCLDTVEAFFKSTSGSSEGVRSPSDKFNRVFKVLKSPLTSQEQPPRLRDLIGYDMYQL